MVEQIRELQRKIDAAPPPIRRIIARHDVPYGRAFRMWNARGELIVYANRGELADLPRAKPTSASEQRLAELCAIPVVFE